MTLYISNITPSITLIMASAVCRDKKWIFHLLKFKCNKTATVVEGLVHSLTGRVPRNKLATKEKAELVCQEEVKTLFGFSFSDLKKKKIPDLLRFILLLSQYLWVSTAGW